MSDIHSDINYRSVQEVAARLDISPATLRKWSDEFADFLSSETDHTNHNGVQQYNDQDITILMAAKQLMNDGMTYAQVRQRLEMETEHLEGEALSGEASIPGSPEVSVSKSLMTSEDVSAAALTYFSETISDLRQGQMSVLNSQAANRELMGVVIQDNFNLKEENTRLRERMLNLEREMGELRRENEAKQDSIRQEFEAKLTEIRGVASQGRKPITILQNRSGCLGSLFGGGSVQVIQDDDDMSGRPGSTSPRSGGSGGTGATRASSRSHPHPPGPPE